MRNFPYELIFYSWYDSENSNTFKRILNEFGIKIDHAYILKLLFAAAEIRRNRENGENSFRNNLNHFYNEYINEYISNGLTQTIEQFDNYLY